MYKAKVRAYTFKEAEEIMKTALRKGYEGVQNDSYRYCDMMAETALDKGLCYICLCTGAPAASLIVCDTHYRKHRTFKEVSKSKFLSLL